MLNPWRMRVTWARLAIIFFVASADSSWDRGAMNEIWYWLVASPGPPHSLTQWKHSTAELYSTSHADTTTDKPFSPGLSVHVEVSMLNGLRPQTAAHGEKERDRQRERDGTTEYRSFSLRRRGYCVVMCCISRLCHVHVLCNEQEKHVDCLVTDFCRGFSHLIMHHSSHERRDKKKKQRVQHEK